MHFTDIRPFKGIAPAGFGRCWLGMRVRAAYAHEPVSRYTRIVKPGTPHPSEEWFEWSFLFDAIKDADDNFRMYELGAGYGRWCVNAEGLARRTGRGGSRHYTAVEAEPTHFRWLGQHFQDNGLDLREHRLLQAAVAGNAGNVSFAVSDAPDQWWGQAIVGPDNWSGDRIDSPAVTLSTLLQDHDRVDIIDMDIQGAELDVVAEAIRPLTSKVRRLFIGTHSLEAEVGLRQMLSAAGWICIYDFTLLSKNTTPIGEILFGDGVQAWFNPVV